MAVASRRYKMWMIRLLEDFAINVTDEMRAEIMALHTELDVDAYKRRVLGIESFNIPYRVKHTNQYDDGDNQSTNKMFESVNSITQKGNNV